MLTAAPHALLDAAAFITTWPRPLAELPAPTAILPWQTLDAPPAAPSVRADDHVRAAVRDLLRHAGFKPTGRSKPASEYLVKAVQEGRLGPESGINPAVDACNVASLHSGLPISVIDLDLAAAPFALRVGLPGESYVFNPSGQILDIAGLLVLCDAAGPCGSPVKDSQRTKTHPGTTRTLSLVWGTCALPGHTTATTAWYRELLSASDAHTEALAIAPSLS